MPFRFSILQAYLPIALFICLGIGPEMSAQTATRTAELTYYMASGLVPFYPYNLSTKQRGPVKYTAGPLKFNLVKPSPELVNGLLYYVVQFDNIRQETVSMVRSSDGTTMNVLLNNPDFINSADNGKFFLIEVDSLPAEVGPGRAIQKRYRTFFEGVRNTNKMFPNARQFTYGASLNTPFKFRAGVGDRPYQFSPEIQLGGFLGSRGRLSHYRDMFLYLPIVTAGFTSVRITDDQTAAGEDGGNGLAMGFSWSAGTVIEVERFQVGFLWGHDYVSGQQGKNWLHNGMPWYSFQIGFNFISDRSKEENAEHAAVAKQVEVQEEQERLRTVRPAEPAAVPAAQP